MHVTITPNDDATWTLTVDGEAIICASEAAAHREMSARLSGAIATAVATDQTAAEDGEGDSGVAGVLRPERWKSGPNGIVIKGMTGPMRDFSDCTFTWRAAPLPLMVNTSSEGHYDAELAGFITQLAGRQDGGVDASGTFLDNEAAAEAIQVLRGGGKFWCSVDPSEYVDAEWVCTATDADGFCEEAKVVFTSYEIAGLTLLPFQGFEGAWIELDEDQGDAMAASAGPSVDLAKPPLDWFQLAEPHGTDDDDALVAAFLVQQPDGKSWGVPITITDDGQVFGHAALWGTCHTGLAGCVTPPASASAYAHFHVGETVTDGGRLATGTLVVGTDHAALNVMASEAQDHYSHTGLAWADVRVTDGVHGVWVCGAVRPEVLANPDLLRLLRASTLSGDWRRRGGSLELIGMLTVSVPGFPVTREAVVASATEVPEPIGTRTKVVQGVQQALVASGLVMRPAPVMEAAEAHGLVARCDDCASRSRRNPVQASTQAALSRDALAPLMDRLGRVEALLSTLLLADRDGTNALAQEALAAIRSHGG